MTDACRRDGCGHHWAAHDRPGHRLACDACPCQHYLTDYRGTARAIAVIGALALFVALIVAVNSGAIP